MKLKEIRNNMKVKVKKEDFTSQFKLCFPSISSTCGGTFRVKKIVSYGANRILLNNGLFYHEEQLEEVL